MNNQSIIDVARGRFLGKMMCPPDTWACRRTDFPPTSEDLRDYCTRSRIKGIHKSVEPEIIRLHSNRDPNMFTATDTEYIA